MAVIAVVACLLAGCDGAVDDDGAPTRSLPPSTPPAAAVTSAPAATPSPEGSARPSARAADPGENSEVAARQVPRRLVTLAQSDLSERIRAPVNEISVISADAVTWPDTSLGCPHPERRYAQGPQAGARIVLEIGDTRYRYHTGGRTTKPFLCQRPTAPRGQPIRPLDPRLTDPPRRQTP
jgi:hypothetical protein